MSNTNSAHESVTILLEADELSAIEETLIRRAQNSESYLHMLNTLGVIKQFDNANKAGDCRLDCAYVILRNTDIDAEIVLSTKRVDEKGWSVILPMQDIELSELGVTQADIMAIENGDFKLDIHPPEPNRNLELTELLIAMDVFNIGRPSTYAKIFNDAVEKQLIDINDGSVRLTTLGLALAEQLVKDAPELSSHFFCASFSDDIDAIDERVSSAFDVLGKYVALVLGEAHAQTFKESGWRALDDLDIEVY
jgi:DNA topoisomerase IA